MIIFILVLYQSIKRKSKLHKLLLMLLAINSVNY